MRTRKVSAKVRLAAVVAAAICLGLFVLEAKADEDFSCDGECEFEEGVPRILIRASNNWHYGLDGLATGHSSGTWHCYGTDQGPPAKAHIRTDNPSGGVYQGHTDSDCEHDL
jgi:hypothetical protein